MSVPLGASVSEGRTRFAVRSPKAEGMCLCLFEHGRERHVPMHREGDIWLADLPQDLTGAHYGYRASGEWAPEKGLWFDHAKLLVDPYAVELDRRFTQHPSLAEHRADTGGLVPRAVVPGTLPAVRKRKACFTPGGLIYELSVRGFTMRHPGVPPHLRGTVAALAEPAVLAHLKALHVGAVELMPIVAWIDERHLPPLGLTNAWGYNPVAPMALDPGLCPGGVTELRETVAALHKAGIGVILDIVLNHTGESDLLGGVICLRGLDDAAYAHEPNGALINDTGCGNTLDFANPAVRQLALDTMRHFVRHCGVDGFRFDLAPVLARGPGFDPKAPIFAEIDADPLLSDRVLIAEPWDIGPGGYQLGHFPANWLEWNDRYRDDIRRFWRGDVGIGLLATRIAGSSDIFGEGHSRTVNFLAAHDGFTLADTVAYQNRHNQANGENNRDGHHENFSWNHGVEGPSSDPAVMAERMADLRAMLDTLMASAGTIMLTAGDEFGRTQHGNNNAYCQDNEISWLDWGGRNRELEAHAFALAAWRAARVDWFQRFPAIGEWCHPDGRAMSVADWEDPATEGFTFTSADPARPYTVTLDRHAHQVRLGEIGGEPVNGGNHLRR